MFLLYAVVAGVLVGLALGGRAAGLAALEFRWIPLALGGFAVQIALFAGPVSDRVGDLGPAIYVASTAAVLVAVLRNVRIPGLAIVAAGALSNLAAIVANGGFMPASPAAALAAGRSAATTYSNSAIVDGAALAPLTDMFALPRWLPFNNVFSIGDVLIAVGVATAIVLAMRSARLMRPGASANLPHRSATN
jgi:lipoprotein signal peptidase